MDMNVVHCLVSIILRDFMHSLNSYKKLLKLGVILEKSAFVYMKFAMENEYICSKGEVIFLVGKVHYHAITVNKDVYLNLTHSILLKLNPESDGRR